jgi:hypothetical protein
MGAARESDQADFDLERFIDMFDTAMTSNDPRVVETLRKLMMIVALTAPESTGRHDRLNGPLRRLYDDMHNLNRSMNRLDEDLRNVANEVRRSNPRQEYSWENQDKYTMAAASNLAQSIDRDVMRQLSKSTAMAINGGDWPKGKL